MTSMALHLICRVGQQRQLPSPLDGRLELALVHRAHAGDAARQDLRALGHEGQQHLRVLVVDVVDLLRAELADLAAAEHAAARPALLSTLLVAAAAAAAS